VLVPCALSEKSARNEIPGPLFLFSIHESAAQWCVFFVRMVELKMCAIRQNDRPQPSRCAIKESGFSYIVLSSAFHAIGCGGATELSEQTARRLRQFICEWQFKIGHGNCDLACWRIFINALRPARTARARWFLSWYSPLVLRDLWPHSASAIQVRSTSLSYAT